MKTFKECKDETTVKAGFLNWRDLQLNNFKNIDDYAAICELLEQLSAELYASQFKIHLSPDRVLTQQEFNKQYEHYQELLNLEDVAGFWKENFDMANSERNNLKVVATEPTEEEIYLAYHEFLNSDPFNVTRLSIWENAIEFYKTKIGRS